MEKLPTSLNDLTSVEKEVEKVVMKNNNNMEVVKRVTEEVKIVSTVNYDITLACKGGATVRKYLEK